MAGGSCLKLGDTVGRYSKYTKGVHGSPLRGGTLESWWLLSLETGGARGDWGRMAAAVLLTRRGSTHRGDYWVTKFGNLSKLK